MAFTPAEHDGAADAVTVQAPGGPYTVDMGPWHRYRLAAEYAEERRTARRDRARARYGRGRVSRLRYARLMAASRWADRCCRRAVYRAERRMIREAEHNCCARPGGSR